MFAVIQLNNSLKNKNNMAGFAYEINPGPGDAPNASPIPKTDALQMVVNYKNYHNPIGDETVYVGFTMAGFSNLLQANDSANGIRIYLARKNGRETIICVLTYTREDGCTTELQLQNDIAGLNFGTLCPPGCSCDCDQQSLAYLVYGNLLCPPPAPQP
jgi:hypothetical protein